MHAYTFMCMCTHTHTVTVTHSITLYRRFQNLKADGLGRPGQIERA